MAKPRRKPPIGVVPLHIWEMNNPDPTVEVLLHRYISVSDAIVRYREAGFPPDPRWLLEVLGYAARGKVER